MRKRTSTRKRKRRSRQLSNEDAISLLASAEFNVEVGNLDRAHQEFTAILDQVADPCTLSRTLNDLAVVDALRGNIEVARELLAKALDVDSRCQLAARNLDLILRLRTSAEVARFSDERGGSTVRPKSLRLAILSFLFNWPSRGGGIVHTVELTSALSRSGFDVRHLFARKVDWGVGQVTAELPIESEALEFDDANWSSAGIKAVFRAAVDRFSPDCVIITDSWNSKPLLAEAVEGYPYILRQQALELLCPLNNLRLLFDKDGNTEQCPLHQLANPNACQECVERRGQFSGGLHRAERELAGVGSSTYDARLRRALKGALAVLVLNPLQEAMLSPFANNVRVVTWGMDANRFPWPWTNEPPRHAPVGVTSILFAGMVNELIKGYHILQDACERLWQRRKDFLLVATGEPCGVVNDFTRFIGWASQADVPRIIRAADILVVPTIAQDGLSRTSVEAMAVGRPVVASRIGGLPYTVTDRLTGLLCKSGNVDDLASTIEVLLNDQALRHRMGTEGRRRFEAEFTWHKVIENGYLPVLSSVRTRI